jgi:hypothetical protein
VNGAERHLRKRPLKKGMRNAANVVLVGLHAPKAFEGLLQTQSPMRSNRRFNVFVRTVRNERALVQKIAPRFRKHTH